MTLDEDTGPISDSGANVDPDAARHALVRKLFDVLVVSDETSRGRILLEAEVSEEIRDEVESLLRFVEATRMDVEGSKEESGRPSDLLGCRVGDFHLVRLIGTGGTSVVFEALQSKPDRTVAVKVLRAGFAGSRARRRFEREVEIAGGLEHPGIAKVLASGSVDIDGAELPWLAMEFVSGGRSITRYANEEDIDIRSRIRLIREVIAGLRVAHRRGVIHRDLKPANLLVGEDGRVRIIDFGIARFEVAGTGHNTLATIPGQVLGTVPFMAPEQIDADADSIDVRADIYSLGVVAYLILTNRMPYELGDCGFVEAARRIRTHDALSMRRYDSRLDRDLDGIVQKMLEKDPDERFQNLEELDADLEAWIDHRPVSARPLGGIARSWRIARRHPIPTSLGTLVVLGIFGATIVMAVMLARESRLRASADRAAANAGLAAASSALRQGDLGGVHRYLESVSESERGWEHDWLSSVMANGNLVLEHREGDVISVDIFPETSDRPSILLATGYRGTWAYELPDCRLRWELEELPTGSWKHAMVPDEDQLLVCGLGPILKVLDFDTGATLQTFETPGPIGAMLPLGDDWVLLGGDDGRLSRMNLRDGSIHEEAEVNLGGVTCMLELEDGRILAGTGRGSLLETDSHLSEVRVARKFARMIPRIRADASESRIAVCTHDNAVEILDAATLKTTMRLDGHLADVWDARFDEENDRIVTVSLDESIRVFDLATGKTIERRSGPLVYVWSLAMEDDGRHVWIGCRDGSVRRLQLRQNPVKVPEGEIAGEIAWSPDGRSLAIRTDLGIHRLDVATRSWTASEVVPSNNLAVSGLQPGIIWSASAIWCASGRGGGLWRFDPDLKNGVEVIRDVGVSALTLVTNDGFLAGLDDGRLVRVSEEGEIRKTASLDLVFQDIEIHPVTLEAYCLSIGRTNGGLIIDCDSLEQRGVLLEYGVGPAYAIAISNDGSRLALGGRERPGNVFTISNFPGEDFERTRRIGHSGDARFVAFIDGGRRLVSGGEDGRVFLGRPDATQPILTMFESNRAIRGLAISPDGRSIAATDGLRVFLATAP